MADDRSNYKLKGFFDSVLPAECLLTSYGKERGDTCGDRLFIIYRQDELKVPNTDYFSSTPGAALFGIQDRLDIRIEYVLQEDVLFDMIDSTRITRDSRGTIEDMVLEYEKLSKLGPDKLVSMMKDNELFVKHLTRKKIFKNNERRLLPIKMRVNLETPDERYILRTTGWYGPYSGTIRYP